MALDISSGEYLRLSLCFALSIVVPNDCSRDRRVLLLSSDRHQRSRSGPTFCDKKISRFFLVLVKADGKYFWIDANGKILSVDPSCKKLTILKSKQLLGSAKRNPWPYKITLNLQMLMATRKRKVTSPKKMNETYQIWEKRIIKRKSK